MLITSPKINDGQLNTNFTNLLTGGYLDGVIIDGHFNITPIMDFMVNLDIPTVVLGHHPHIYSLRSDNVEGGRLMMEHLIELGHQRIGLISVPDITERLAGVRLATEKHDIDFDTLPHYPGSFSEESGASGAEILLRNHPELTALVAFNDRMAMGAINRLREMGYRIPDDISVIGYDDLPRSRDFNPPLTTINHQLSEWGLLAMEMLLDIIKGKTPQPIVLAPQLVVRHSTTGLVKG
jgi:DNA-binding LacI/PurR family transcriptional regulator